MDISQKVTARSCIPLPAPLPALLFLWHRAVAHRRLLTDTHIHNTHPETASRLVLPSHRPAKTTCSVNRLAWLHPPSYWYCNEARIHAPWPFPKRRFLCALGWWGVTKSGFVACVKHEMHRGGVRLKLCGPIFPISPLDSGACPH